jgi:thioredoxin 1
MGQNVLRVAAVAVVIAAVIVVLMMKRGEDEALSTSADHVTNAALPVLLDLGSDTCVPCRKMEPILAALRQDFAGEFQVRFIDVRKAYDEAKPYGVRMIPTQVFFDADGNELFRHEGFYSRGDILARWRELGYDFGEETGEPADVAERHDAVPIESVLEQARPNPTEADAGREPRVIVYYFHRTLRCETCLAIERQAAEVIAGTFADELASGELGWRVVNFDLEEHRHFESQFDLMMSSLVIAADEHDGDDRWVMLHDVWDHVDTGEPFQRYIESNVRAYLDGDVAPAELAELES